MAVREIFAYLFFAAGSVFAVITVLGLIRFPDVYTRIHAAAVVLTISAVLITIGVAIHIGQLFLSMKVLLIGVFFLVSNPMATHSIARSSYQKKIALPKEKTVDDYSQFMGNIREGDEQ